VKLSLDPPTTSDIKIVMVFICFDLVLRLLGRKGSGSGLERRDYGSRDPSR
jgi:hypothetical protein